MSPALAAALLVAGVQAATQDPVRLSVLSIAPLAAPRLVESSGAAMSALEPGIVWTHNDSGDGPFLYATDPQGRDHGRVRVDRARNVDWEDLAAAPCIVVPGRCLYVGDIGDNARRRRSVVVYRLREPSPPRGPADTLRTVPLLDSLVLRYPDKSHDAEALAVSGNGTLLVVTKDRSGPAVAFSTSASASRTARTLARLGPLDISTSLLSGRLVTGAALAPGDSLLVLRTYVSIHLFHWRAGSAPVRLGPPRGVTIPAVEPQGEGVAFDGAGRLVLTSERGEAPRGTVTTLGLTPAEAIRGPRAP